MAKDGKPEYDLNNLISDYKDGKNLEYIYFWGHHPKKMGVLQSLALASGGRAGSILDILNIYLWNNI